MLHFDNDNNENLKEAVLRMRYGDTLETHNIKTFSDFGSIATTNKTSRRLVEAICLEEEFKRLPELVKRAVDRD